MRIREVCVKYVRSQIPITEGQKFKDSRQVFEAFREMFLEPVEVFRVLLLDSKNHFLHFEDVSRGSLSTSVAHPRLCSREHKRGYVLSPLMLRYPRTPLETR